MKAAWLTDLHLDLVGNGTVDEVCSSIEATNADIVLFGGDMGQVDTFELHFLNFADRLQRPCYFVLGNHDHYGNTIKEARRRARELTDEHPYLFWLPGEGVVKLTEHTALIGHGLWGDGRAGNGKHSMTELADFALVTDLCGLTRSKLLKKLKKNGDEAAIWVRDYLEMALREVENVLLLAHVPPFADPIACPGRASDNEALPFYTCVAAGDVILEIMESHPTQHLTILSGHTHTACRLEPAPNIEMLTGGAKYFEPKLQRVIHIR